MFTVRITDGLGNQLFQYAYALAVHKVTGMPVSLDLSWFPEFGGKLRKATPRPYALAHYPLSLPIADKAQTLRIIHGGGLLGQWNKLVHRRPGQLREGQHDIEPESLAALGRDYAIRGFFQKACYAEAARPLLLRDLTLDPAGLNEANRDMLAQIKAAGESATMVHIRRGDYLVGKNTAHYHVCGADYYRAAEQKIAETVSHPLHLFIFSDDPAWVRGNYRSDFPMTCIGINSGSEGHLDINLMRHCRHGITANSTFSWWGAWLIDNPDKVVVAPKLWFLDREQNKDLLPQNWSVL